MEIDAEKFGIDDKKLAEFLPINQLSIHHILALTNNYTWEQIQTDPEKGRAMMAELQKRTHESRDTIVDEIVTAFFEKPYTQSLLSRDPEGATPSAGLSKYKTALHVSLGKQNELYNPAIKRAGQTTDPEPLLWFIKDYLIRTIRLGVILKLKKNPRFQELIKTGLQKWSEVIGNIKKPPNEAESMDAFSFQANRNASEEWAILYDYELLVNGPGLSLFKVDPKNEEFLRNVNHDLIAEIRDKRAYQLQPVYTFDHVLGFAQAPLVMAFEDPTDDRFNKGESMAMVLLISEKKLWDALLQKNAALLEDMMIGKTFREDIKKALLKEIDPLGKNFVVESDEIDALLESGFSFFLGSFPLGVRWSDTELIIPNSDICLKELLPEDQQGWYEALRFSILSKLRSLLMRERKDVSSDVIGKLRTRQKGGNSKITNTMLRARLFPRTTVTKEIPDSTIQIITDEGDTSKMTQPEISTEGLASKIPKRIIGYQRKLPEGKFASPKAVALATKNGITLASEIGADGVKRYTETFTKDFYWPKLKPGQRKPSSPDLEAKFIK